MDEAGELMIWLIEPLSWSWWSLSLIIRQSCYFVSLLIEPVTNCEKIIALCRLEKRSLIAGEAIGDRCEITRTGQDLYGWAQQSWQFFFDTRRIQNHYPGVISRESIIYTYSHMAHRDNDTVVGIVHQLRKRLSFLVDRCIGSPVSPANKLFPVS